MSNPISAREAFAQMSARNAQNNPWTAADEARSSAKRAAEQAAYAACADEPCEEYDDDEQEDAS